MGGRAQTAKLPSCDCKHVDYCGHCMKADLIQIVKTVNRAAPTLDEHGQPLPTTTHFCDVHGELNIADIIRGFPDGHECSYA